MTTEGAQTVLVVTSEQTSKRLIEINADNVFLKVFPIRSI